MYFNINLYCIEGTKVYQIKNNKKTNKIIKCLDGITTAIKRKCIKNIILGIHNKVNKELIETYSFTLEFNPLKLQFNNVFQSMFIIYLIFVF